MHGTIGRFNSAERKQTSPDSTRPKSRHGGMTTSAAGLPAPGPFPGFPCQALTTFDLTIDGILTCKTLPLRLRLEPTRKFLLPKWGHPRKKPACFSQWLPTPNHPLPEEGMHLLGPDFAPEMRQKHGHLLARPSQRRRHEKHRPLSILLQGKLHVCANLAMRRVLGPCSNGALPWSANTHGNTNARQNGP